MNYKFLLTGISIFWIFTIQAQNVTILPSGVTPATGGYPRLQYDQILVLPSPQKGDLAIDLTFDCIRYYNGTKWVALATAVREGASPTMAAWKVGGNNMGDIFDITTDTAGSIYITGRFYYSLTIESTTITATSFESLFIAKFNSTGALQWLKKAADGTTPISMVNSYGIALDLAGNIYIAGSYFYNTTIGTTTFTQTVENYDAFWAKYDANGNFQWAQKAGGDFSDYAKDIVTDALGNIYIAGIFNGTAYFGATSITSNASSQDIFIAKCSGSGVLQAVQKGGGNMIEECNAIAIDGTGMLYITGYFTGSAATFGTTTLISAGNKDFFVAKFNPITNAWVWAQRGGTTGDDIGFALAVDNSGNIYTTGQFTGSGSFGASTITSNGGIDIFVNKHTTNGGTVWTQRAGGSGDDFGRGIAVDEAGNVYNCGYFAGTMTFGSTSIALSTTGQTHTTDVFINKYSSQGAIEWAQKGGGSNDDYAYRLITGTSGTYLAGIFNGTSTFGVSTLTGSISIFIMRAIE